MGDNMVIDGKWEFEDAVSGLKLKVIMGAKQNRLHIESLDGKMNRDFWFRQDGTFDGTGSTCSDKA